MYCGRRFTKKGVYEHERHSCKHNPNRRKRTFGRSTCKLCGKRFHSAGLRAHVATQHPEEFAREKKRRARSPRDKRKALVRNEAIPNEKAKAQPKVEGTAPKASLPTETKRAPSLPTNTKRSPSKSQESLATVQGSSADAEEALWVKKLKRKMSKAAAEVARK